ncbi:MAG: methyltransferase domain-containing protein [Candidatus Adlerbacteria bacterium]|nr:methyltransferase domain-containing protein [Candidatus Adlerbacteria bacterium]
MEESSFLNPTKIMARVGLNEGLVVADMGSGSGFFARAAARAVGEGGVVWAVDINRELLPRIKTLASAEGLNNVEVVQGDASTVGGSNLPDEHFDFVIVSNILFSLEQKAECVAEVRRILKRGGRALVVDWAGSFGGLGPHESHVVTAAAMKELFEKQGFAYLGEVPAGFYHWGFVVKKTAPRG